MAQYNLQQNDIVTYRGDDFSTNLVFRDSDGGIIDITGWKIFFTVKKNSDKTSVDTAALITKDITIHDDATAGITTLALSAVQTNVAVGDYKFDLRVYELASSTQLNTASGTCTITDVVTKRTS